MSKPISDFCNKGAPDPWDQITDIQVNYRLDLRSYVTESITSKVRMRNLYSFISGQSATVNFRRIGNISQETLPLVFFYHQYVDIL